MAERHRWICLQRRLISHAHDCWQARSGCGRTRWATGANRRGTFRVTSNAGWDQPPPTIDWGDGGGTVALNGSQVHYFSSDELGFSDADGDSLDHIKILSLPTQGTLLLDGYYPVAIGETIDSFWIDYGYLVYVPDSDSPTSYATTFTFSVNDGQADSLPASLTINVSVAGNTPPTVTGSVHSLSLTSSKTLTAADLGYNDADGNPLQWITITSLPESGTLLNGSDPVPAGTTTALATSHLGYSDPDGDLLQSITITALPETGTLTLLGSPVAIGTNVTVQQIQAGYLAYAPNASNQSAHAAAFSFTTSDGNLSSAPATITFNVAGNSNTAPVTSNLSLNVPESGWLVLSLEDFPYSDADGDELSHITILSLPSTASLTVYGYPVSIGETIDAYTFYDGAVELYFESTTGGATTRDESRIYLSISASTDADDEVTSEGFYSIDTNQFKDTGRSGSGTYTRVDGDTTFTGTASLTESTVIDTGVFLLFSLDEEGQWQLGASRPNADFATGLMYSDVTITFDTRYDSASGDVDGEDGPTHSDRLLDREVSRRVPCDPR